MLDLGQRPVNNVVDATNYVLLEMGHPMHAFDHDLLKGGRIVVRRPQSHERQIVTLDGVPRALDEHTLLVCDAERPVAIAGVMGGQDTEVSDSTVNLLLESAYFDPASIRRTGKRLGLSTEASYRFERGADQEAPVRALNRCSELIMKLAGGSCVGPLIDEFINPRDAIQIELSGDRIQQVVGQGFSNEFVVTTLEALGYKVELTESGWSAQVPGYRIDTQLGDDLIEDLLRHHGYNQIPVTFPPAISPGKRLPQQAQLDELIQVLLGAGYSEAVSLAFTTPEAEAALGFVKGPLIAVGNPLSEDLSHLRSTLAAGLISSVRRNLNFGSRDVLLFEMGKVFIPESKGEELRLGIVATGNDAPSTWQEEARELTFFHLKGVLEELFSVLQVEVAYEPIKMEPLQEGLAASLQGSDGQQLGWLGRLSQTQERENKFLQPVFLAEITLHGLLREADQDPRFSALDRFPSSDRDLSFLVDKGAHFGRMKDAIKALNIPELRHIQPIDFYHGPKLPAGKKSLTIRLTFANPSRTLKQDEIAAYADTVFSQLSTQFGAELRS